MKELPKDTKFAHLGKPGTIFSKGFSRRLNIITDLVDFKNKKILDVGCGEGVWLKQFLSFTNPENIYGIDIDPESIEKAKINAKEIPITNIKVSPTENISFDSNFFDIVFQNEVLEHVINDVKTLEECLRILKLNGKLIIFTPNSGWPFETHGIFFKRKYYWGNIPFLPWLPKSIQKKYAPHVRNYTNNEIIKLFEKAGGKIIYHKHVFPGFDGAVRRFGIFGKLIQSFFFFLEKTPFHWFGISHLVIVEKNLI